MLGISYIRIIYKIMPEKKKKKKFFSSVNWLICFLTKLLGEIICFFFLREYRKDLKGNNREMFSHLCKDSSEITTSNYSAQFIKKSNLSHYDGLVVSIF